MAAPREALEWESAIAFGQYTLSSCCTTLPSHGQRIWTYHTLFTWKLNRRYKFNMDTVLTYRSLCYGYRITDTSRFGNILLLFLLVSTCQISTPTFNTRYHAIYFCGWWCRGSTHLQMQLQGLTTSGNKHILTIIDHLTGWPEAFHIPDKSANTIVSTFINKSLPVHMCLRYILSDNGTEFKNNIMDQVLKQLGIKQIFSPPYHPWSNGKLEVFHKYLKTDPKETLWEGYI